MENIKIYVNKYIEIVKAKCYNTIYQGTGAFGFIPNDACTKFIRRIPK
jgi:hypothetical protein